jgi:hypothetical protein
MVFFTQKECLEWCTQNRIDVPEQTDDDGAAGGLVIRVPVPGSNAFAVSKCLEEAICPWNTCLLWVTGSDVWRSSTNLHLYYALRRSYGDHRLLSQAPGHMFSNYEGRDLISFIHLAILFGWDAYLLSDLGYGKGFLSHDSWFHIWRSNSAELKEIGSAFEGLSGMVDHRRS